jgi:hypothetical protein
MFTDKVQGFYVEDHNYVPMLFLHNSLKDYHFGRKVFGFFNDGSYCETYNLDTGFYPFTEANIAKYREIWKIEKKINELLLQMDDNEYEKSLLDPDYNWTLYNTKERDSFLSKIKKKNCLVFEYGNFYTIKKQDTTNPKNDFICEDINGDKISICMIQTYFLPDVSLQECIDYQIKLEEYNKEYFELQSEFEKLNTKVIDLSIDFCLGEVGLSFEDAKTFEYMYINDLLEEEEIISEELADIEELKAELISILPNPYRLHYNQISVSSFLFNLEGNTQNYNQLFVKEYYNSRRQILHSEDQKITYGLIKDAKAFCSFHALCECIIHNKKLFEYVSSYIEYCKKNNKMKDVINVYR